MKHFKSIFRWTKKQEILFFIFLFCFMLPNIFLFFTESDSLLSKLSSVIFPLGLFWGVMTLNRKPGKMIVYLFFFIFLAAFQLVLLYLFGESIIAVDMFLNVITTNPTEATELLGNIIESVIGVFLIYGSVIILSVISIKNSLKLSDIFIAKQRKVSTTITLIGIVIIGLNYIFTPRYQVRNNIYPVNVCYNLGLAINREHKTHEYHNKIDNFTFNAKTTHNPEEKELYVLIVGETSRASNFGIYGYKRNTTPQLCQRKDNLIIYHDVLTQSNTTHKSVPMILSAANAENYDCIYNQKSIISAFKEAGYETSFFSNQKRNGSFIDFFGEEADYTIFLKDNLDDTVNIYDAELLPILKDVVTKSHNTKQFIVLHTYGSHFDYKERYPSEYSVFTPDYTTSASAKTRDILINSYDNTILYIDNFINEVINIIEADNRSSAVMFLSDHGEDIFDDNRNKFLHASPKPTIHQLNVPFFIWISEQYSNLHKDKETNLKANTNKKVSTNLSAFHTMLSMAGIHTKVLDKQLSLADSTYNISERYYLNDHNRPVKISDLGLAPEDIQGFKTYNLSYK